MKDLLRGAGKHGISRPQRLVTTGTTSELRRRKGGCHQQSPREGQGLLEGLQSWVDIIMAGDGSRDLTLRMGASAWGASTSLFSRSLTPAVISTDITQPEPFDKEVQVMEFIELSSQSPEKGKEE